MPLSLFTDHAVCHFSASNRMEVEVHYPFVGLLNKKDKDRYYLLLCEIMRKVELSVKGVSLSKSDRMIVAAPAAILTLGCKQLNWNRFKRVFVYPTSYKNRRTGNYHHGETSPMGVIVVNWKRVKEGIDNPDDALHLLYHEYAHALLIVRSQYRTREDRRFVRTFNKELEPLMHAEEIQNSPLLRRYAFTNHHEFFACVTEEMMERADLLKAHHPKLYELFLKLLMLEDWEDLILKQSTWYRA